MKHLLNVIAHPNPGSFNHALWNATTAAASSVGARVVEKDLVAEEFNPVMSTSDFNAVFGSVPVAADVAAEQAAISASDIVIIHYPVVWFDRPAILKGWFDRVLTVGFAFGYEGGTPIGMLTGKRALVVQTAGVTREGYGAFGSQSVRLDQYPAGSIRSGTLEFCGIETSVLTHYGLMSADKTARARMLSDTTDAVAALLDEQKK